MHLAGPQFAFARPCAILRPSSSRHPLVQYDELQWATQRSANCGAAYFAGLGLGLLDGVESSISAKLRSSCNAACIQVLDMSSNTWRCRSDLVSSAQRKHSSANSRNSLGDAAIGALRPGGSATGLSATDA